MEAMNDITIIMLTQNKVPTTWARYYRRVLTDAIGDTPLISISREPMDWGVNMVQTEPESMQNVYWQILKGARQAETSYIAIAEDDTLYPQEHFEFRPTEDSCAYNMTRWILFTWGKPFYFYKPRIANGTMIASRERVIRLLEERFERYPKEVPHHYRELDETEHAEFYTYHPIVCFNHDYSFDHLERTHRKQPWPVQAFDIPKWGRAEDVRTLFQ